MDKTILKKVLITTGLSRVELDRQIAFLYAANKPKESVFNLLNGEVLQSIKVQCTGIGEITNAFGEFIQYSFLLDDIWSEYSVLVRADEFNEKGLPKFKMKDYFLTRFDSHCETQMLFGDKTCDCKSQLYLAMEKIANRGEGAIVHIKKHEGRGKGIESKLDQLRLCSRLGIDTVLASQLRAELIEGIDNAAELPAIAVIDKRDFLGCVAILEYLNVPKNIKLLLQTNNPMKMKPLLDNGYSCKFYNIHTTPNEMNIKHLEAKKRELNHKL
ncbi:MAG: hypothetical protein ABJL44_15450 [Algibacter sp.]